MKAPYSIGNLLLTQFRARIFPEYPKTCRGEKSIFKFLLIVFANADAGNRTQASKFTIHYPLVSINTMYCINSRLLNSLARVKQDIIFKSEKMFFPLIKWSFCCCCCCWFSNNQEEKKINCRNYKGTHPIHFFEEKRKKVFQFCWKKMCLLRVILFPFQLIQKYSRETGKMDSVVVLAASLVGRIGLLVMCQQELSCYLSNALLSPFYTLTTFSWRSDYDTNGLGRFGFSCNFSVLNCLFYFPFYLLFFW